MSDIANLSKLSFLKVNKYEHKDHMVNDFRKIPRPHFCMGLVYKGEGFYTYNSNTVHVSPGDVIFVPVTSRYIADWRGTPDILYISMHFSFENSPIFTLENNFHIQKITLPDSDKLKEQFHEAFCLQNTDNITQLKILSIFYDVLFKITPELQYTKNVEIDSRIMAAIEYITLNYNREISIQELAAISNMSTSHFHSCFKDALGVSPIKYKNKICINRAILYLISDNKKTIDEIAELTGFESDIYFRRVFKEVTGMSPRDYKKNKQHFLNAVCFFVFTQLQFLFSFFIL